MERLKDFFCLSAKTITVAKGFSQGSFIRVSSVLYSNRLKFAQILINAAFAYQKPDGFIVTNENK